MAGSRLIVIERSLLAAIAVRRVQVYSAMASASIRITFPIRADTRLEDKAIALSVVV